MESILSILIAFALAAPLGWWIHRQVFQSQSPEGRAFEWFETLLYRVMGVDSSESMSWSRYARSLLWFNMALAVMAYTVFVCQGFLPLNPEQLPGLSWDLALHTAISFVTNTNQQHYSGQAQLSYLSQSLGLVTLQFLTPATGLAAMVAMLRALRTRTGAAEDASSRGIGNFWIDVTRSVTRVLAPLALVVGLVLASQGVPSTWQGGVDVPTLEQPADGTVVTQHIPLGPIAPMVAIKQLGTNGGGWFGPNSTSALENPTALSNLVQLISIILVPMACVWAFGLEQGRRRTAAMIAGVMFALTIPLCVAVIGFEFQPNAAFDGLAASGPNWEGKEMRLGIESSALWASLTTQTSNGSVNAMHDSLNPLGGMIPLLGMFINSAWGGIGVGLMNFVLFLVLAVFLSGLMVGRSPEWNGRRVESREIRLASVALLVQPLLILVPAAITLAMPEQTGISNPGPHGLSQVLYEYASAFANNGSGFEGLGDATPWWNVSCSVVLILGRYIPMFAPLAIAAAIGARHAAPQTRGTLRTDTALFGVTTLAVILLVQLLNFLPILVLGPVAEELTLSSPESAAASSSATPEGENE